MFEKDFASGDLITYYPDENLYLVLSLHKRCNSTETFAKILVIKSTHYYTGAIIEFSLGLAKKV